MNKIKGAILVFLGACSFGMLSTIVKKTYEQGFTLGEVTGIQSLIGASVLWVLYLVTWKSGRKEAPQTVVQGTAWWKVLITGSTSGAVSLFYYQSVQLLPASIAIILLMQYLWISVVLELIFSRKTPSRSQIISIVIVLVGTCFAGGLLSEGVHQLNLVGIIFGLLAALAYASFLLVSGKVANNMPPLKKSALIITGAAIMIMLIFPPTFLYNGALGQGLWKWGIPLALLGTIVPPVLFSIGVPKAGLTLSAILSSVELPVAVLMSYWVLHESVDLYRWMGVGIIILAIVLPNLKQRS